MDASAPDPTPDTPDPLTAHLDRGSLQDAHGRTGRMLKNAGLPFEEDEFDGDADSSSSSSSSSSESSSSSSSDSSSSEE
jgi:hypothetical protein